MHSDYDKGLEVEELKGVAWGAGLLALTAWLWLWIDTQSDGVGATAAVFWQAVGTMASVASGVAAVLCGVKGAEHRLRYLVKRD